MDSIGTPRSTNADGADNTAFILLKRVSELRATYQIRLLTYFAFKEQKSLIIYVPLNFQPHPSLVDLQNKCPGVIKIVRKDDGIVSYRV